MNRTWYSKRIVVVFIFLIISLFFLYSARDIKLGNVENSKYAVYSIRFEYFGMDAENIERIITVPLEEKISCMSNLLELRSTVEYGKSLTTAYFNKKINSRNTYLEIRDYVDALYNALPSSVQKPRIFSSDVTEKSVINVVINGKSDLNTLRTYVTENLKPKIESIDGVSEVIVSGGNTNEILIEYDNEKIINSQINPIDFGSIIQDANVVNPSGKIKGEYHQQSVVFDTKLNDINDVKKLPVRVQDGYTSLEYLADVSISPRENDEIVRVNGEECVSIQVSSSYSGNNISISREVKKILEKSELNKENYQILQDNGLESFNVIKNVIVALIESFIFVIIIIPVFYKSFKIVFLLFLIIPINIIWTIAQLYIFNFSIDQNILSGITIAIGFITDSALIIAEICEKSSSFLEFEKRVKEVFLSIIASSFTTILALIPLYFLDSFVPGIKSIAISIVFMIFNSTAIALVFLPAFIYTKSEYNNKISIKVLRLSNRLCYRFSLWSIQNGNFLKVIYIILCVCPLVFFFILGKNISLDNQSKVIFSQVEYENDKDMKAIDEEVSRIVFIIKNINGVEFVMTDSRKGSCEIEIGYNDKLIDRYILANKVAELGDYLAEGFLYVPEKGLKDVSKSHEIEIILFGDDSNVCRNYAREIVNQASKSPYVSQAVLNFKDPEEIILIRPDIDLISKSGSSIENIASQLRWTLFGPVVDKWIQNGKEMDIRIVGKDSNNINLTELENTYIILGTGFLRLKNVGIFSKVKDIGKIYRNNNRRCAYCTLSIKANSSENAINISKDIMKGIVFEKGYGYHFSRDLELMNEQYYILFFVFISCVIIIVIFLTAITEDIKKTLLIISIIPASLFIPFLYQVMRYIPLEIGAVVGMILISGISVNNSIYIMESKKEKVYYKVRDKFRSIIVTSFTTIIGAMPLIVKDTGNFAGTLSVFMVLGVLGSLIISVIIYPGVIDGKQKLKDVNKVTRK